MNVAGSGRHTVLKRIALLVSALSTAGLILVACGGGDSRQPTEPASTASTSSSATSDADRKQALAVPPGWVGRVPKPEVINGITVPPEPDPTINNSTLAGVDSNKNGVRDDVERIVARQFGGTADYPYALAYAREYQRIIVSPTPTTRADALVSYMKAMCRTKGAGESVDSLPIDSLTANTPAREQAHRAFLDVLVAVSSRETPPCVN